MTEETTMNALRLNVKLERKLDKGRKMNEQERRNEYFKLTGKIATSDQGGYFAFCKGMEYERKACCKAIDAIDDGEAPEYRACQEAIMERSNI